MTSRLKRKLNDLGVDPSSSKANESFCLIGTPLPPLEKSRDTGEFVPLWKQDVRDEQGRKRLHGAFTGGFSAGYFNTVGSKEGWTPSTFVSSRTDRAQKKEKRAEDFMDEEDLAELRDSRKLVDENEEMDLTGGTQAELRSKAAAAETEKDAMALSLEEALLPTPKDSAGARVLKKMGWRPGQGIGPRLTWRQRKIQELQESVGYLVAQDDLKLDESNVDEEAKKHTYPRRDTPMLLVPRKENSHGIGYVPGMSLDDSLGGPNTASKSGPQISAGFGLGASNEADEDDVDIYDSGISSSRNRTAYENLDIDDQHLTIGSRSALKRAANNIAPVITQTFQDGRLVLAGFLLSEKPAAEDRWFPLPDVPSWWKPDPRRVWQKEKDGKENKTVVPTPVPSGSSWRNNLSADQRGDVLGETPIAAKPRSVFEYMSQKDRDRLQNAIPSARQPNAPPSSSSMPPPPLPSQNAPMPFSFNYPRLEPQIAKAALSGFKPFTSDPVKQSRYTAYLKSQSEARGPDDDELQLKQTTEQNQEHFQKELDEYKQAAIVFKPLSGAMAGRFTSAVVVDHGPQGVEGLHTPSQEPPEPEPEPEVMEEEENAKTHAVKMKMYGTMTREVVTWVPAKLLCKRFGVKEPEIAQSAEEAAPIPSAKNWEPEEGLPEAELVSVASGSKANSRIGGGRRDIANIGMGEDETQGTEILTYERPAKDIFKAIFASDDEESDEEDGKTKGHDQADEELDPPLLLSAPVQPEVRPKPNAILESVDLATFKPIFVSRSEREGEQNAASKKRKKDKDKKKVKTLVSFEVEEDEGASLGAPIPKERSRKKRKAKHTETVNEDEEMWVEKPVPAAVQALGTAPVPSSTEVREEPARARKRATAADFM